MPHSGNKHYFVYAQQLKNQRQSLHCSRRMWQLWHNSRSGSKCRMAPASPELHLLWTEALVRRESYCCTAAGTQEKGKVHFIFSEEPLCTQAPRAGRSVHLYIQSLQNHHKKLLPITRYISLKLCLFFHHILLFLGNFPFF